EAPGRLTDGSRARGRACLLVASPAYLETRGPLRTPADLAKHDVIFTSSRPGPPEWRFRRSGRDQALFQASRGAEPSGPPTSSAEAWVPPSAPRGSAPDRSRTFAPCTR